MKTYRETLKSALEKAHCAAMESGIAFTPDDSKLVTADALCRHFAGQSFDRLVIYTRGPKNNCTGGVLYLAGFKVSVAGDSTHRVRVALARKLCGMERVLLAQEVACNG